MLNSWLSSRSSRHRKTPSNSPPPPDNARLGPSGASSLSQSTAGPVQIPGNLTSVSDVPLDELHADRSIYAPTPSLIHSTEKAGTLKTSDALVSLDPTPQVSATEPEGTLLTPQDAIIAHVFGKSAPPATDLVHTSATPPQPSVSQTTRTFDSVPTPPSIQPSRTRSAPALTIYDPFSGTKLGEHTPISPSTATPGDASVSAALPTADDRKLWSSLERILELQAEVAAMHADMEGVGKGNNTGGIASTSEGGNVRPGKQSLRRGLTLPVGDEEPEEPDPEGTTTGAAVSEASTEHSDGEDGEEDEDVLHGYGKRRRDEEFARLTDQFAQRKAAICGVMNKLDALSTALKTFHTLPPPLFDLSAAPLRTDTMSSTPPNVSAVSSPPPFPVHPGRLSSLPPSTSPFQAGNPITTQSTPLSPPIPPISTLAPPASSANTRAPTPPALTPIVAPVLPQTALPTIIPGAPHVESPADMRHTQSVFQRAPR